MQLIGMPRQWRRIVETPSSGTNGEDLIGKENEGKGRFFKEIVKNDGTKAQP
jgi:hypothetical protein